MVWGLRSDNFVLNSAHLDLTILGLFAFRNSWNALSEDGTKFNEIIDGECHDLPEAWVRSISYGDWCSSSDFHVVTAVADEHPILRSEFVFAKHELCENEFSSEVRGYEVVTVQPSILRERIFTSCKNVRNLESSLSSER